MRKKRLRKIREAEDALNVAIRAAEEKAEREGLPTEWFHISLKYLARLAREAA